MSKIHEKLYLSILPVGILKTYLSKMQPLKGAVMKRIDAVDLFLSDDLDFIEAVYQQTVRTNKKFNEDNSRQAERRKHLRTIWPPDKEEILGVYQDQVMDRETFELNYAVARGHELAYQMYFGLASIGLGVSFDTLHDVDGLKKNATYIGLCKGVELAFMLTAQTTDVNTECAALMADYNVHGELFNNIYRNLCLLFGFEYAVYLIKLQHNGKAIEEKYIEAIYNALELPPDDDDNGQGLESD